MRTYSKNDFKFLACVRAVGFMDNTQKEYLKTFSHNYHQFISYVNVFISFLDNREHTSQELKDYLQIHINIKPDSSDDIEYHEDFCFWSEIFVLWVQKMEKIGRIDYILSMDKSQIPFLPRCIGDAIESGAYKKMSYEELEQLAIKSSCQMQYFGGKHFVARTENTQYEINLN